MPKKAKHSTNPEVRVWADGAIAEDDQTGTGAADPGQVAAELIEELQASRRGLENAERLAQELAKLRMPETDH